MYGWNGKLLRVDLTRRKVVVQEYGAEMAKNFLGGRGFAAKILWDELTVGMDPFSPENRLIFAAGPLTGFALPNSGKLVVAAKSPLTGGYGDGNVGTFAGVQMRRAGYDAAVIEGKAEKPKVLLVKDSQFEFLDAKDLWGLTSFEAERKLRANYGKTAGILSIGQAGENLVKFAIIASQEGRSGGRPGIGAVMGSKNLKAAVFVGSGELPAASPKDMKEQGLQAYREVLAKPDYAFWKRQGTMSTIEWSNENSVLPTHNYSEGVFEYAEGIGGFTMEKMKVSNRGCPNCNMTCGNVVKDADGRDAELDYENVAMLGADIGLGDLGKVAALNRMADEYGLDTISLGSVIAFAIEASEKGLVEEKIVWGDYDKIKPLVGDIAYRRGFGDLLAEGVQSVAEKVGNGSDRWAMHVKGLEVTAYDCHAAPAMALAYGTSLSGAHHKDAWVISWDIEKGRESYGEEKADKVIELQRIRSGVFECLTTCRFPHAELGFEFEWYPKLLSVATGQEITRNDLDIVADRVFNLVRAVWIREFGTKWSKEMDTPPARWFDEPLTKGPLKGSRLDRAKYDALLQAYYRKRGWDDRGIPTGKTLNALGLGDVASQLRERVGLRD